MAGRASHVSQTAAILKVSEVARNAEVVRSHVRRIVESPALKGSKRSQEFLQFIVERALEGHFEELKERTLGVELFGRQPSYDTGADAIVRVTACDVRRRLLQFYAEHPDDSEYRIELPPGSYIPEFRTTHGSPHTVAPAVELAEATAEAAPNVGPARTSTEIIAAIPNPEPIAPPHRNLSWPVAVAVLAVGICVAAWFGYQAAVVRGPVKGILPWSAVTPASGKTHIIFCDPEIVTIQRLTDYSVTLSDYANQRYWPRDAKPEILNLIQSVSFRGVSVAVVDAATATKISSLAARGAGNQIETRAARTVRLTDFNTDDSFILFGSPRSNPWVGLFQEQLGFRFEFDNLKKAEFIRDTRPTAGDAPDYVPTAVGWATGQAYAVVSLVSNPNQTGQVLILAGSNAEATEAAGRFATNLALLSQTLKSYGIDPAGPHQPFEVLLRVSAMAGSPSTFEVVACRKLPVKV